MAGYPKIWVTKLFNDEWFLSLSNKDRGIWLQLICLAKLNGDSGQISTRGFKAIAEQLGVDRRSLTKTLRKFDTDGKISLHEKAGGILAIHLKNYMYYQSLTPKEEFAQLRKNRQQEEKDVSKNALQPEQTKTELKQIKQKQCDQEQTEVECETCGKNQIAESKIEPTPTHASSPDYNFNYSADSLRPIGSLLHPANETVKQLPQGNNPYKSLKGALASASFFAAKAIQSKFGQITIEEVISLIKGSSEKQGYGNTERLIFAVKNIKPPVKNPAAILWDFLGNPGKYLNDAEYNQWKSLWRS